MSLYAQTNILLHKSCLIDIHKTMSLCPTKLYHKSLFKPKYSVLGEANLSESSVSKLKNQMHWVCVGAIVPLKSTPVLRLGLVRWKAHRKPPNICALYKRRVFFHVCPVPLKSPEPW